MSKPVLPSFGHGRPAASRFSSTISTVLILSSWTAPTSLPQGLSGQDYDIFWDAVPEYEAAAYPELPITMFHVYYGTRNEGD